MRHNRLPRLDLPGHTYFLTCCLHSRQPLFAEHSDLAEFLIGLYAEAQGRNDIALHGCVIMPDHYHVVLTLLKQVSISNLVRRIHSAFSREFHQRLGNSDQIWQERFYDHVVRDEQDWRQIIDYVHHNPVAAGIVNDPKDYLYSSYRFWQLGDGPIECMAITW